MIKIITESSLKPSTFLRRDAIEYLKNPMITARWSDAYTQEVMDYIKEVGKDSLIAKNIQNESSSTSLRPTKTTKRDDGTIVNLYRIHDYDFIQTTYPEGYTFSHISVNNNMNRFVPVISIIDDMNGTIKSFKIQTTSYGTLPLEEIKEYISKLQAAVKIVEILTYEFIK